MSMLGRFLFMGLAVVALSGCASGGSPQQAATADVSGKWQGTWAYKQATLGSGQMP